MTPKDIKKLIKMLRDSGVTHYKTAELELNLAPLPTKEPKTPLVKAIPLETATEEDKPIEHTEMQLTSLLKLSDVDLLDRLFPDHTKEAEESAIDTN
jgi:hypothetical protein